MLYHINSILIFFNLEINTRNDDKRLIKHMYVLISRDSYNNNYIKYASKSDNL